MYQPHDFKEAERSSRRRDYQIGSAIPKGGRLDHKCLKRLLARDKVTPDLIGYRNYVVWNGVSARSERGEILLVGGLRREMRRMLLTGKFGPIPNLWINSHLWWLCRDELRWPDRNSAENIKRFQIIEVRVPTASDTKEGEE